MRKILGAFGLLIVILTSCGKQEAVTSMEKKTLFYRVSETSLDGKVSMTDVKRVDLDVWTKSNDDDDDHDEDEDENDSSCHPLPIIISSFSAKSIGNRNIEIQWESEAEDGTDHYTVERSEDSKTWKGVNIVSPGIRKYVVIDRY